MLLEDNFDNLEDDEVFQFLAGTFHQDTSYEEAPRITRRGIKRVFARCCYFSN